VIPDFTSDPTGRIPPAGPLRVRSHPCETGTKDSATSAGEPLVYLSTANPEISSAIMTIPPRTTTEWMTHPVQGFVFVLEGTLTVEYAEGERKVFKAGQGFPQARSKWHRGRNDGDVPMRFLAVFFGAKDMPNVLHPPAVK
jgi:quercetin dioxygenase-like cupin family protein